MEIQTNFTAVTVPGTLSGSFYLKNQQTKLTVSQHKIVYKNNRMQCSMKICLQVSYEIHSKKNKDRNSWVLNFYSPEKNVQFVAMEEQSQSLIWESFLKEILVKRRFHDNFRGIRIIGSGNHATVYMSQRIKDDKFFAVKSFKKQKFKSDPKTKQGIQNEITIHRKLSHPNIAKLQSVYESQNSLYLIIQLIQGKNLSQLTQEDGIINYNIRNKIIKDILSALCYLDRMNVVHRDVKLENVIVDFYGNAKIIDFGLAAFVQEENYVYVKCGTPGFIAPEILSMNLEMMTSVKMRTISDVFSAGAILYQMIFGHPLFDSETNDEILQKNYQCNIKIPINSDFSNYQEMTLLRRMLDLNPDTRITASQALKSRYFGQEKTNLCQNTLSYPSQRISPSKYKTSEMQDQNLILRK